MIIVTCTCTPVLVGEGCNYTHSIAASYKLIRPILGPSSFLLRTFYNPLISLPPPSTTWFLLSVLSLLVYQLNLFTDSSNRLQLVSSIHIYNNPSTLTRRQPLAKSLVSCYYTQRNEATQLTTKFDISNKGRHHFTKRHPLYRQRKFQEDHNQQPWRGVVKCPRPTAMLAAMRDNFPHFPQSRCLF